MLAVGICTGIGEWAICHHLGLTGPLRWWVATLRAARRGTPNSKAEILDQPVDSAMPGFPRVSRFRPMPLAPEAEGRNAGERSWLTWQRRRYLDN